MRQRAQIVVDHSSQANQAGIVGLDLGDRWSRYCTLDAAGTVIEEDRVRSTPEGFSERFGRHPVTRIVIEAGIRVAATA
jgi:hypothetical protein